MDEKGALQKWIKLLENHYTPLQKRMDVVLENWSKVFEFLLYTVKNDTNSVYYDTGNYIRQMPSAIWKDVT